MRFESQFAAWKTDEGNAVTDLASKLPPGCAEPLLQETGPGGEYVLASWPKPDGRRQWVTWLVSPRSGTPCAGRYFVAKSNGDDAALRAALDDFRDRVKGRS